MANNEKAWPSWQKALAWTLLLTVAVPFMLPFLLGILVIWTIIWIMNEVLS